MAEIRVWNPSYTPRAFFGAEKGGTTAMAKRHRHHRHHHRRHNPFGISGNVIKDAAYTTAGALAAPYIGSLLGQSGWLDVAATAGAGMALSYGGKMVLGAAAAEELLKGALVATIIKAVKQAGFGSSLGLGMYVNSNFPLPTASDAYGRVVPMLPPARPSGGKLSGYNRFRSRYGARF